MHLHSADTAPPSPHPTGAAITPDFAATWPAVETPLRRYLGSIGVNRHDIDDLVQETASRVIASRVPYDGAADLRQWAFVVARRLLANLHRSRQRQAALDGAHRPDPAQDDLMRQVEDRLIVEKVIASAANLTTAERRHLAVRPLGTAAERNRANVARHRARQHLRKLVGPLAVTLAVLRRRATLATSTAAVGAAVALPLALLPAAGHGTGCIGLPHANEQIGATTAAVTSVIPQPARTATPTVVPLRAASHHGTNPTSTPKLNTAVRASGPAQSNAHAAVKDNDGKHPLLCTSGTIAGNRCVRLPPGIGERVR